jgi:PAS domain S-box-containing protein
MQNIGLQLDWDSADWWQSEWVRLATFAVLGTAASYVSVNIPYTDIYIEGRWVFGTMGFALLKHWWAALLLACALSFTYYTQISAWTAFFGNMMYALPSLVLIRVIHTRVLDRLRDPVWYGLAWLLMLLLGYQLFTPVVWVFSAFLEGDALWPALIGSWRAQPFLVESLLVGIISALAMTLVRSNAALRMSRRELSTTLYSIGDGVIATDADGRIRRMNPVAEHLTGWREAEAIGQPLKKVFYILHEETREPVEDPVGQVQRAGHVVSLAEHTLLVARDGTECPITDSAAPIQDERDAMISGVVLIFRDQTQARAAQRALQKSHEQMAQILATVPAGVMLLDAEGHVLQTNPTAAEALGVLVGDDVGPRLTHLGDRPLAEWLTPPSTDGLWHEIKAQGRTFEAIARPVEHDFEPEHWVLVVNDVTREREVRVQLQQQERLAVVGQLAAGIAHDFNNIIAIILLHAHIMEREESLTERDRERLSIIRQQAWHASRLIEQILDFSRRAVLERQSLDLLSLFKEQVKLLQRTLPENVAIFLEHGLDAYIVHADPTRMQQMLTNLAVNARDAMPDGGALRIALTRVAALPDRAATSDGADSSAASLHLPRLGAEAMALRKSRGADTGALEGVSGWIRLMVSDTGTGIEPDVLPHIFEPFFTTKGPGEGSGLGLAQVYGIVRHHEGYIDVTTKVGEGTMFTIYLPALETHQPEVQIMKDQAFVQGAGETILVVEDETTLRQALVENLELLNYNVLEAADGHEALDVLTHSQGRGLGAIEERCASRDIALVLSDLVMPEMGGQALFQAMQQRGLNVPMVILSGHPMESELGSLEGRGLAGWMLKPPDMEQLSQLLARVLKQTSSKEFP